MTFTRQLPKVTYDQAFDFTLDCLRRGRKWGSTWSTASHIDLDIRNVAYLYVEEHTPDPTQGAMGMTRTEYVLGKNLTPFVQTAWALVNLGVIVPGNLEHLDRGTPDMLVFSLTDFGRQWLESRELGANPHQFGEFGRLLAEFDEVYGEFYAIRAQEALSCFRHGNHVACCAMAGACAETILFTAYAKHLGDQEKAIREMTSSGGRGRVEAALLGRLKEGQRMELQTSFSLIKYWRDNSAHGLTGRVDHNEAYVALLTLLNLAQAAKRYLL